MALSYQFSLVYTDTPSLFRLSNDTVYGGANPARNAAAEILLAAYVDENLIENFITVDSTDYLTKILYDINNSIDGHYHFEALRFPFYDVVLSYFKEVQDTNGVTITYPGVFYYATTGFFYKCIADAAPGTSPTNTSFFVKITDFTSSIIRMNTNIIVGTYDTVFDHRGRICVKDELINVLKQDCSCIDLKKLLPYLKKSAYLKGAKIEADNGDPQEAEIITRTLDNLCGN